MHEPMLSEQHTGPGSVVVVVLDVVVGVLQGCRHTPNVQLPDVALQAWGWSATQRAPGMEAQSASV